MKSLLKSGFVVLGLFVLTVAAAVASQTKLTDTGYGYSDGFTSSMFSCNGGTAECGYGQTSNLNYSYTTTSAYYLQATAFGWNTDEGTHCIDWEGSSNYNVSLVTSPDTMAWGDLAGHYPDYWVTTYHYDLPQSGGAGTTSFTSSDRSHSSIGYAYCQG